MGFILVLSFVFLFFGLSVFVECLCLRNITHLSLLKIFKGLKDIE